jgi:hypothetical protein
VMGSVKGQLMRLFVKFLRRTGAGPARVVNSLDFLLALPNFVTWLGSCASNIPAPCKRAVPPLPETVHVRAIPPSEITVGDMGTLGTDGRRYKVLPDGETKDLTPRASRKFYVFGVDASKHKLRIMANGLPLGIELGSHLNI